MRISHCRLVIKQYGDVSNDGAGRVIVQGKGKEDGSLHWRSMKLSSRSRGTRPNKPAREGFLRDVLLEAGETGKDGDGERLFAHRKTGVFGGLGTGGAATSSSSDVKETNVDGTGLRLDGVPTRRRGPPEGRRRRKVTLERGTGTKGNASTGRSRPSKHASASERF